MLFTGIDVIYVNCQELFPEKPAKIGFTYTHSWKTFNKNVVKNQN